MSPRALRWLLIGGGTIASLVAASLVLGREEQHALPAGPMPTIRLGSSGEAVALWQTIVGAPTTSVFDAATDQATRAWQAQRGLAADGVVGPATWAAAGLAGSPAPLPRPGTGPSPGPVTPAPPPSPAPTPTGADPFGLAASIAAREQQIVAAVGAGEIDHQWWPISWTKNGREVEAQVSRRALAISRGGKRLIVSVTYPTAQRIAEMLGGAMLTTRMSDEVWRQADKKLAPLTRPWSQDGTMARTDRMIEQSVALDQKVGGATGLVANEGKDWVVTRRNWLPPEGTGVNKPEGALGSRHNGANFGWYGAGSGKSPGGETVIQSVGLAHDMGHTDYSQLARFVRRGSIKIDGHPVDLDAALRDPDLSPLLQDEGGTLPSSVHPDLGGVA